LALLFAGDGSLTAGGGEQPRTVSWCAAPILDVALRAIRTFF